MKNLFFILGVVLISSLLSTEYPLGLVRSLRLLATGFLNSHTPAERVGPECSNREGVSVARQAQVLFRDQLVNCEDGVLVPGQSIAILSCDPGRDSWNPVMGSFGNSRSISGSLYLYDYANRESEERPLNDTSRLSAIQFMNSEMTTRPFHPLGIEYDQGSNRLFVADRVDSTAKHLPLVHVFSLDVKRRTAALLKSFSHPMLLHAPNSIAAINGDEILVTNDHGRRALAPPVERTGTTVQHVQRMAKWYARYAYYTLESVLALPFGSVTYANVRTGELRRVIRGIPFANGIVIVQPPNSAALPDRCRTEAEEEGGKKLSPVVAVASSSGAKVFFFSLSDVVAHRDGDAPVSPVDVLRVPFFVDNLYVDQCHRHIFAGGHPDFIRLKKISIDLMSTGVGSPADKNGQAWQPGREVRPSGAIDAEFWQGRPEGSKSPGWVVRMALPRTQSHFRDALEGKTSGEGERAVLVPPSEVDVIYRSELLSRAEGAKPEDGYGSISSAAWDEEERLGMATALYGRGIMVW